MAGNAKQYTDLQQASALNDTDKFAVAQADAEELKTVTTTQVAQKVAAVISSDQLTEFISDVGLGKQVLAQALNNKGAGVTATDTLQQMAAKVAPLDVVGAKEYIRGTVSLYEGSNSWTSSVVCMAGVKSNRALIMTAGKLALVELADDGTLKELASVADSDMVITRYCGMFTNAAGTVAIYFNPKSTTASQAIVFDVNPQNGTLSLRGKIENLINSSATSPARFFYISDAGDKALIFSQESSDIASLNWLNLTELSAFTNTQELTVRLSFNNALGIAYDVNGSTVMFVVHSSLADMYPVALDFDAHSVSFGSGSNFSGTYAAFPKKGGLTVLPEENVIIKTTYENTSTYQNSDVNILLQIFDLKNNQILDEIRLKTLSLEGAGTSIDNKRIPVPFVVEVNEDYIEIDGNYLQGMQFNRTHKEFTKEGQAIDEDGYFITNGSVWNTSISYDTFFSYYPIVFLRNDITRINLIASAESANKSSGYAARTYRVPFSKRICFGSVYKRNGHSCLQVLSKWNDAAYEAGAYNIENSSAVLELEEVKGAV